MEEWQGRCNVPSLCGEWGAAIGPLHISFHFSLSPMEPLERACAQFALHPFSTSYRCKMLPCRILPPPPKPGEGGQSPLVHSSVKASKQTNAGLEVRGENSCPLWFPFWDLILVAGEMICLVGAQERQG